MFGMRVCGWRRQLWAAGPVLAGLLLGGPTLAQAPDSKDYLEQVRRLNEVAAQKLEADVQGAVREADKLRTRDSAQAVERLKHALAQVEADTVLDDARRASLKRTLQARLRLLQATVQREQNPVAPMPVSPVLTVRPNLPGKTSPEDPQTIQRTLETIRGLQKEGRHDEARRLADDLARRYPGNAVVQATVQTMRTGGALAGYQAQRGDMARRVTGVAADVQRSSLPAAGEVEFPKDWRERTKNRSSSSVALTDKEKAILKSLNSIVSVHFKDTSLENALKSLSDQLGQPIILDKTALQEAQVNYDSKVTMDIPRVAARTALRKLLGEFGLAYVIRDQTIEVTSALKAKEMMVTRSYYLGDLAGIGQLGGLAELRLGGIQYTQQQMAKQVQQIIDVIQSSIEPSSWRENGGNGTIFFHAPSMSLIIKQSAEVHGMISGYLK